MAEESVGGEEVRRDEAEVSAGGEEVSVDEAESVGVRKNQRARKRRLMVGEGRCRWSLYSLRWVGGYF